MMFDPQEIHNYTAKALQALIGFVFFLFVLTAVGFFALGRYSATPTDSPPAPSAKEE